MRGNRKISRTCARAQDRKKRAQARAVKGLLYLNIIHLPVWFNNCARPGCQQGQHNGIRHLLCDCNVERQVAIIVTKLSNLVRKQREAGEAGRRGEDFFSKRKLKMVRESTGHAYALTQAAPKAVSSVEVCRPHCCRRPAFHLLLYFSERRTQNAHTGKNAYKGMQKENLNTQ